MLKQDWPTLFGMAICGAVAIGCGIYMISGGVAPLPAMVVAIFALCLSQVAAVAFTERRSSNLRRKHEMTKRELGSLGLMASENRRQIEAGNTLLSTLRSHAESDRATLAQNFADLKQGYSGLAQELHRLVANPPVNAAPAFVPAPALRTLDQDEVQFQPAPTNAQSEAAPELANSSLFGDQLLVSLEPVIDLGTGRTAHYRMHMAMAGEEGQELASDLFLHHADRTGLRPELDVFVAREAEHLLRRLRQRDATLNIFVPIGAATLAAPDAIARINEDRSASADVAAGLVFELPHAMLAGLTEQGLEGLAELARQGARFALTNISVSGLDLAAMNTLNVRYVGLDASAIDPVAGPSVALASFNQTARASRVQLMITGVANPKLIGKLPQITRLAAGPCFAPPRRVKREHAQFQSGDLHAAA